MDDSTEKYDDIKREAISHHNREMRRREMMTLKPNIVIYTRTGPLDVKPTRSPISLDHLLPIHCSSLVRNTLHSGRVLRGTLIVDPLVVNAAYTIIEDEVGNIAQIAMYNFTDSVEVLQRHREAISLFSPGKKVAIIEPYYELAQDGHDMVRVESFSQDVVYLEHVGPRLSEDWRSEGKAHFNKMHFDEALHCFRRSIDTQPESKLTAIVLSNIATCLMLKQNLQSSLLFAVASFMVDNSLFRPYYTAGFVLSRLKRKKLAFNCLEKCQRLKAPASLCRQLIEQLGDTRQEQIRAPRWNADILSIVTSKRVHQLFDIHSDAPVKNYLELKEKGNNLFKQKRYDESIREYCLVLRGTAEVAILLNNRAICYARTGNHTDAALHASAAALISPSLAKAHYWKSMSLLQLSHIQEAQACCEIGLSVVGGDRDLEKLHERIALSLEEPDAQPEEHPYMQKKWTERQQEEILRKGFAQTSSVARFNEMIEFLNLSGGGSDSQRTRARDLGLNVDKRVAPFHLELSREGKWPSACDAHHAIALLKTSYENARAPDPAILKELLKDSVDLPRHNMENTCKRLGTFDPNIVRWWLTAPLRCLSPRMRKPYASNVHGSFTNSVCRENVISCGEVHVSIGFVDLSELLWARIVSSADQSGPLRWIGYEASAYSVAKSTVIAQMLRQQADTEDILQVWFSSTWTIKTLRSFRTALRELVDSTRGPDSVQFTEEVVMLWNHWQQFDVSLRTARSEWLSRHNLRNHVEIANFRRKSDRIALCRYVVSGDVLEGTVGSVVMFGLPKNKDGDEYEICLDEWFLHCLSIYSILKEIDSKTDIIAAAIRNLQRRISKLKELVRTGNVEIDVRHKMVQLDDERTLHEIRKLSPHSMSWSNLCDYCPNEVFHNLARTCSGNDTIHYLYSMNWSTEVKGAHLMDFDESIHREVLYAAKEKISAIYRLTGVAGYLHDPPITDSQNLAQFSLAYEMHKPWTDNFFDAANLVDKKKQVVVIEPTKYDVLARAQGSLYMVYTFNPTMKFNPIIDS